MLHHGQCHRDGELIDTLCEQTVPAAERTELSWLWPTCADCLRAAKRLNGITS
ncbi:hypothetical protein MOQ72_08775 [Saccharopolyspora sp. K220]|uniref:zinc finger protein n=1 Tax=Saccharopolyspora soli TaxID=2926618 RepID=UPI001F560979|nr:zinc finger protein [Saccharopolyspora soli]MCI2417516.1 hypothetical protein [Saccharopolyspora soli]